MEYIAHRINTIKQLLDLPENCGLEVDLRDHHSKVILQHEPFQDGENFEEFLKYYKHQTIILNIKSERIEHKVLEILKKYNVKKYFFLDSSFPMINIMTKEKESNIALRFSEYEGIDTILTMAGKIKWVWVDCFTQLPINKQNFKILKDHGFNLCLVSPELQNQDNKIEA